MTQLTLILIYVVFACGLMTQARTMEDRAVEIIIALESWLFASYMLEASRTGILDPVTAVVLVVVFTAILFVLDFALAHLAAKALNE